ncbi:PepSY-associated TM helix domain-containing protein [Providencia sp. PROV182]|uniref:PepSY-associated TM helix domain-containing protein n=1 Tax=Providencia sp. PROV182 TaxID=2949885 RepID=UPI002349B330|nr:PepSY-associated TM helix domain-containing protein [Providencia sp. PROV182]
MKNKRSLSLTRRFDQLHRSAGALFGVFLFVILFTGCWSLGSDALRLWGNKEPLSGELLPLEQLLALQPSATMIQLPEQHNPVITFCQSQGSCELSYSAINGKSVALDCPTIWLVTLHKNLFIDFPGRIFISLFGFALAVLLITGLVIQRRRIAAMVHLPRITHLKVLLHDLHSWLGLWCYPWLVLFAFTGALSGLGALGTVSLGERAAPDNPQIIMKALMGEFEPLKTPVPVAESSITAAVSALQQTVPSFIPQTLFKQGEMWVIGGVRNGQLSTSNFEQYQFDSKKRQLVAVRDSAMQGIWTRAFIAIQPLHYGQYQWLPKISNTLSYLHFIAGLSGLILISVGLAMWCWKRNHSLAARFIVGSCGGLLLSACALLAAVPWFTSLLPIHFFIGWGIACTASLLCKNAQFSLMACLFFSAILLLFAFIASYLFGSLPFSRINLVLLCGGIGLLFILFGYRKLSGTAKGARSEYERSITK